MSVPVLFDIPGPRARVRIRIGTVIGSLLIVGLVAIVLIRLGNNGQLDGQRWAVLFDSRTGVPQTLWRTLLNTLQVAAVAMVVATIVGLLLAVGRLSEHRSIRWLTGVYIEFFRAIPLLVVIFALYFLLPKYDIRPTAFQALAGGLILYNSAVLAEIFRAGILSIDKGQSEAAFGIGMRKSQVMTLVLLPQATRRMLPVLIAQLVVLLKDSSLGFIIGYFELLRGARSLVEFFTPRFGSEYTFQLYVAAGLIYIVINVLLSQVARTIEKRTRQSSKSAAAKDAALPTEVAMGGSGISSSTT